MECIANYLHDKYMMLRIKILSFYIQLRVLLILVYFRGMFYILGTCVFPSLYYFKYFIRVYFCIYVFLMYLFLPMH